MSAKIETLPNQEKRWKQAFWITSALITLIMTFLSRDYGQSGDEWLQIIYGQDIWNYFHKGDLQALDYANKGTQYQGMEFYGGLFDYVMAELHSWFPSIPLLILRHFFNALCGAVMMIFTGLLAKRLSGKWMVGLLALLFIFFSPRIFGESMNNPKDIPFACGFILGVYGVVALLQDMPARIWRNAVTAGIGFGIAYGIRSAGGILLAAYMGFFIVAYYVLNKEQRSLITADKNKLAKRLVLALVVCMFGGFAVGSATWPWGLQAPFTNPFVALEEMTNRSVPIQVLFEGVYRPNTNMPWYYQFKWIGMSNPIIVIIGVALFLGLVMKAIKKYSLFSTGLLLFCAFFPLVYLIYKHSTVHDTWRHVFFVYPYWVVMAALSFDMLADFVKNEKLKPLAYVVGMVGLLPAIIWTIRSHPNQYVYFNELQGGVEGAYGYYDLDYYQNTSKQAADWILKNVKPVPGKRLFVRSNMNGYDKYFANDTTWLGADYGRYTNRYYLDWDYYIAYSRYISSEQLLAEQWPPANVVHRIEIDGVPLAVVIERKSKAGIAAHEAFAKQDFATAIPLYEEYLKTDNTDENVYRDYGLALVYTGRIDEAIAAVKKATEIDPGSAELLGMLAKLYNAKGDQANEQQVTNRYNELIMRMQEAQGESY